MDRHQFKANFCALYLQLPDKLLWNFLQSIHQKFHKMLKHCFEKKYKYFT